MFRKVHTSHIRLIFKRFRLSLPGSCFLCGAIFPGKTMLCPGCYDDLNNPGARCRRCGTVSFSGKLCVACIKRPSAIDITLTARTYTYPATTLIKGLKYNEKIPFARQFAQDLAEQADGNHIDMPEVLLPVPLHPVRKLKRGFNQADAIASSLSKKLGIPVDRKLLSRKRNTRPQFQLSNKQRLQNLKGAFRLTYAPPYTCVAIIDDILTTGATANEIARTLKKAGIEEIQLWAWANAL